MAIRVGPDESNPTHDISLSDGLTTIGLHLCNGQGVRDRRAIRQGSTPRTSLQIQSGDPDYSGFNLPYTPITQKDWSGGRGQADYKRDATRYMDGYRVNTIHGPLFLGPLETNTTRLGETTGGNTTGTTQGEVPDLPGVTFFGTTYTAGAPLTINAIRFKLGIIGTGGGTFVAQIYSDDGSGYPLNSLARSASIAFGELPELTEIEFPISYTFVNGTDYHVGFTYTPDSESSAIFAYDNDASGEAIRYVWGLNDITGQFSANAQMWFETALVSKAKVKFFDYRGARYAIRSNDDGTAPTLWRNGFTGHGKANGSDKGTTLTDTDLSGIAENALRGAIIKIIAGTGQYERVTWRQITGNTNAASNNTIRVSPAWNITQDTTTEWVILGTDEWSEITGHGLTGPVTDVLVVNELVYFAQGDAVNIRRGRYASGSWSWADDSTNKATFMKLIPTAEGTAKIWLAQATTSNVYNADPVGWGTDLTLAQKNGSKPIGNPDTDITGMIAYGNPRIPYFFKEDGFGSIADDVYAEIPNAELAAVSSDLNGRTSCVFGVYLFFNILDGWERYFDQQLDDIGPNRDEGLPTGRQGWISAATPYPGGIYVAIDAGTDGQSAIMFWSSATGGWHELYRAPHGKRISDIKVQVIPGRGYQRLWFNQEGDFLWIPVAINPLKADGYRFADKGYIISSWYKTNLGQIKKFWRDLQMFIEQAYRFTYYAEVAYQVDDGEWIDILNSAGNVQDWANEYQLLGSASPKHLLESDYSVTGERIRFKVTLYSGNNYNTPRIIAWTINAVTRVPPSKTWALTFQADDTNIQESESDSEALDMDALLAQLESWANSDETPAPLTMRSVIPQYDNKRVFIDNPNVNIREVEMYDDQRDVKSVGNLTLYEA